MSVRLNVECQTPANRCSPCTGLQDVVGFRWDKADLAMYYRLTGEQLYDIDIPHDLLSNDSTIDEAVILPVLDGFYRAIVSGLFNASVCSVPRVRHSFYKFWWDEELSLLKDNSIRAHKLWTTLGKPRSGDIFRTMQQAKYEYKSATKAKEKQSKVQFTDELNDALMNKDMHSFWKFWKSKFPRN